MTGPESRVPPVIVTLPSCIDLDNCFDVFAELVSALIPGAQVVIADLTATTFCDTSAVRQIELARQCADEAGVQFRAVVPAGIVLRVLQILGIDQVWMPYPTLHAALAQERREAENPAEARRSTRLS